MKIALLVLVVIMHIEVGIIIRDLPLHLWNEFIEPYIGNKCGDFVETSRVLSSLRDMMELRIKVKGNDSDFIPASIELPPSIMLEDALMIHIDPFFNALH